MLSRKESSVRKNSICLSAIAIVACAIAACQGHNEQHLVQLNERVNSASLGAISNPLANVNAPAHNVGRRDRLTVVTFNMEHRDKPRELAVMAERLDADLAETPDFILCQEVLFERSRVEEESNTAALLANELGCHWRGTKRTSDREGVAIISRYPFAYYDELHLKSQTSRMLLGFRRVSIMGEFNIPDVGLVRVVNVHFTNWGFESHVRRNQLEETLEWLEARDSQKPADLIVLGGDFNIKSGDEELNVLTDGKFAKRFAFRDFNTDNPTRGGPGKPKYRIDYLFVSSKQVDVRMAGKGEQRLWLEGLKATDHHSRFWLSDHVPLLHEYAFTQSLAVTPRPGRTTRQSQTASAESLD
jgi:endonuclease/exonuclease/phosphatase family metal-dependent hydrolase